jgi:hypothetical protein
MPNRELWRLDGALDAAGASIQRGTPQDEGEAPWMARESMVKGCSRGPLQCRLPPCAREGTTIARR